MTYGKCKDCKWWEEPKDFTYGICELPKYSEKIHGHIHESSLCMVEVEGLGAGNLWCSPAFGCIQFESKEV